MIKKITKCLLALSLLLTGVVLNPTRIHAEDAQPYAAVPTLSKKYFSNIISLGTAGYAGTVTLDVTMNLVTTSTGSEMTYYSSTCTPGSSTTSCQVYDYDIVSTSDYTTSYDNTPLVIDYYIKTVKNGKTYYTVYEFIYKRNAIYQHSVVEGPKTTKIVKD